MNTSEKRLTPKQAAFVAEYLVDLNATQAAIRAGYSERTAAAIGAENLTKPQIAAAIQAAMNERAGRVEVTADRVLQEFAHMGLYDPADIAKTPMAGPKDIAALPEPVRRAIVGWGWDRNGNFTLKLANKQSALDSIAKHLGMYVERHEHTGKDGGPIETRSDLSALPLEELLARRAKLLGGEAP